MPTPPSRTSRGAPATRCAPRSRRSPTDVEEVLVLSGDVPLVQADLLSPLLEARGLDHAAIALVSVDALDPTGLGRVVRNDGGHRRADRRGQGRDRRGAPDHRDQRRPVRDRRRVAPAPDRRPATVARRPASCTSPTSSRSRARTAGIVAALEVEDDGRLTGHQRPRPARPRRVGHAGRAQRPLDEGRGHDGRPVDGLPRPRRRARRGRRPRAERRPARRDAVGGADPDRDRVPDPRLGDRRATASSGRASSSAPSSSDDVTIGPFSHLRPGAHVGDRSEIGNFAELKNSTPRRARPPAPHELPRRRRRRRRTRTSGPGTITANYDGVAKHRTTIGERRVPRRRHDAPRAGHARRRRPRRAPGAVVTQGRARRASSRSASRRGSASPDAGRTPAEVADRAAAGRARRPASPAEDGRA